MNHIVDSDAGIPCIPVLYKEDKIEYHKMFPATHLLHPTKLHITPIVNMEKSYVEIELRYVGCKENANPIRICSFFIPDDTGAKSASDNTARKLKGIVPKDDIKTWCNTISPTTTKPVNVTRISCGPLKLGYSKEIVPMTCHYLNVKKGSIELTLVIGNYAYNFIDGVFTQVLRIV